MGLQDQRQGYRLAVSAQPIPLSHNYTRRSYRSRDRSSIRLGQGFVIGSRLQASDGLFLWLFKRRGSIEDLRRTFLRRSSLYKSKAYAYCSRLTLFVPVTARSDVLGKTPGMPGVCSCRGAYGVIPRRPRNAAHSAAPGWSGFRSRSCRPERRWHPRRARGLPDRAVHPPRSALPVCR